MSEVDKIEERLRGPVNCWLNNLQQIDFARLVALAREAESLRVRMKSSEKNFEDMLGPVRVYDRPPTV